MREVICRVIDCEHPLKLRFRLFHTFISGVCPSERHVGSAVRDRRKAEGRESSLLADRAVLVKRSADLLGGTANLAVRVEFFADSAVALYVAALP